MFPARHGGSPSSLVGSFQGKSDLQMDDLGEIVVPQMVHEWVISGYCMVNDG